MDDRWDFDALPGTTVTAEDALAQPSNINAQVDQALGESLGDRPEPPEPPDTYVRLPGGLYWDGELLKDAEVREMTGEDEEELARVKGGIARWISVLLERNVVRLGGLTPTPEMIRRLLVGDRDALILGVRIATFGKSITAHQVQCPHCQEYFSATVDLSSVDQVGIEEPRPRHEYEVELRHGRTAVVRLPDGAAQEASMRDGDATPPERNTALLASCLVRVVGPDGEAMPLQGEALAKRLSTADRGRIIRAIAETQPGPKLDAITFAHESCGKEVLLPIDFGDLFRGE